MAASRVATFLESFDLDPKTRGTQWEHVCKWFLETDPVYRAQLKKVWLWNKWPGRWGPSPAPPPRSSSSRTATNRLPSRLRGGAYVVKEHPG